MVTPPIPGSIRVLVGYDGSPSSINAVEIAAQLIPSASAFVLHLWQPPFTSPELGSRLVRKARTAEELADLLETEGRAEAERLVRNGVTAGPEVAARVTDQLRAVCAEIAQEVEPSDVSLPAEHSRR